MSLRKIADKLKSEEQKLQMASEDVDDDDDMDGKPFTIFFYKKTALGAEVCRLGDGL